MITVKNLPIKYIPETDRPYSLDYENIYADYNGGFAVYEDPADYIKPIKAVRLG